MKGSRIYIIILGLFFLGIAGYLGFAKREAYSELERRDLAAFPGLSAGAWLDGSYTEQVAAWYADTVPGRDGLTTAALALMEVKGVRATEEGEEISFHNVGVLAADDSETGYDGMNMWAGDPYGVPTEGNAGGEGDLTFAGTAEGYNTMGEVNGEPAEYAEITDIFTNSYRETLGNSAPVHENQTISDNYVPVADEFTRAANGIIITGSGANTRAIMLYGGSTAITTRYAEVANHYKELLPDLNVYVCVIPTSVSYYCPEQALSYTGSQLEQINNVMENLRDDVIGIDVYTILGEHRDEDIYLRTDHHWAPLGAYYAASKIAEAAGLPFLDLSEYDEYVVHNFVGTMYMYSQDIRVSSNPEDFVWYEPKNVELKTTYINYLLDANWNITGVADPMEGNFFRHYTDGSTGAYCTFMGGDAKITQVETSTDNGRRLLILKDSYGNALPPFLFGSFEEVHVIDSRYFRMNILDYIEEHEITDILFANNAFHASIAATVNAYERYLTQGR